MDFSGLINLAKKHGYLGYKDGKYYVRSKDPSKTYKDLKIKLGMKTWKCSSESDFATHELIIENSKSVNERFEKALQAIPYEFEGSEAGDEFFLNEGAFSDLILFADIFESGSPLNTIKAYNIKTGRVVTDKQLNMTLLMKMKGITLDLVVSNNRAATHFSGIDKRRIAEVNIGGIQVKSLNTCPVPWFFDEKYSDITPKMHPEIKEFFTHLFPIKEEREYVFDWMYHMVESRNNTALSLIGKRGVGKDIFAKICASMFESEYVSIVGQSFLDEKFNAAQDKKRLLILSEVNIKDDRAQDTLKRNINDDISIEKKGVDSYTTKNNSSMLILSNRAVDFGISQTERRYSIPEIATKNLKEIWENDRINDFVNMVEKKSEGSDVIMAEFAHWICKREPKYGANDPLKGPSFYRIAEYTTPEWIKALIEFLVHEARPGEYYKVFPSIKKFLPKEDGIDNRVPRKKDTVIRQLDEYRYLGVHSIGHLKETKPVRETNFKSVLCICRDENFVTSYLKEIEEKKRLGWFIQEADLGLTRSEASLIAEDDL